MNLATISLLHFLDDVVVLVDNCPLALVASRTRCPLIYARIPTSSRLGIDLCWPIRPQISIARGWSMTSISDAQNPCGVLYGLHYPNASHNLARESHGVAVCKYFKDWIPFTTWIDGTDGGPASLYHYH